MTERGVYIHIPFCDHICAYCDFNKFFMKNQPVDRYLDVLAEEMAQAAAIGSAKTVYIGGGTPTALTEKQLERLLADACRFFSADRVDEFTVEANPENLTAEKLAVLKAYGVNRLSIGVQSFDDRLLKAIGRAHSADAARHAVQRAQRAGFDNVSLDLMFALPGQTETMLRQSIAAALALSPQHLSIYSLQVEPKTIFYNLKREGKLRLPGDAIEADMYAQIIFELEKHGLKQYEISNFAHPGFEGQHNSLYWQNEEYFGIGAGAHGYVQGKRYANAGPLKPYFDAVRRSGTGHLLTHPVTDKEQMEEQLFLGLRLLAGVRRDTFARRFGCTLDSVYRQPIADMTARGLLVDTDTGVRLTRRGLFLGNEVFEAFLLS
ncbi:MAG: radical SAM family heme chaperone HemW [Sporolactobacillus sp.]